MKPGLQAGFCFACAGNAKVSSRYCQSDRLRKFAITEFGHLEQGYWRVKAIENWVHSRTTVLSGSSDASTSKPVVLLCLDMASMFCRAPCLVDRDRRCTAI
jgi:hypothetical protein